MKFIMLEFYFLMRSKHFHRKFHHLVLSSKHLIIRKLLANSSGKSIRNMKDQVK